jgi:hypothetical protein
MTRHELPGTQRKQILYEHTTINHREPPHHQDECDTNQHKYRTKTIHHMRIQKSLNLSPKQEN